MGARRASWRVLSSIEAKEKEKGESERADQTSAYRARVEAELEKICNECVCVCRRCYASPLPACPRTAAFVGYARL